MSNFTFYRERKEADDEIVFLFLNLQMVLSNSTQGKFTYIWQSKWFGIIAIKIERVRSIEKILNSGFRIRNRTRNLKRISTLRYLFLDSLSFGFFFFGKSDKELINSS